MKQLDRTEQRKVWKVYRSNHGTWVEICRTPDKAEADRYAKVMQTWDCPTMVRQATIEVIVDLPRD